MPPALPVVRVTAPGRNLGKTLLASRLIEELAGRGYVVAALKHSHHPVTPDRGGSDTDRFARAGAATVLFGGSDGWLTRSPLEPLEAAVERMVGHADIAIVEGFKDDHLGAVIRIEPGTPTLAHFTSMDGRLLASAPADEAASTADAIEDEFELTTEGAPEFRALVRRAAAAHGHRCAGITLGVRMALAGLEALRIERPAPRDRLQVVVETARCATDAIAATTGLTAGSGALRIDERGEMAAVFTDTVLGRTVRVAALESARVEAARWAPPDLDLRHQQDIAYRVMPDDALLRVSVIPPTDGDGWTEPLPGSSSARTVYAGSWRR